MRIAIIDDFPEDRKLMISYLNVYFSEFPSSIRLYIHEFESGEDFISTFNRGCYDIIFIDYYLKNMTGMETSRLIRQTDRSVPLIFMTSSKDYAVDAYRVKASGYLVKPFTYRDLAETIFLLDYIQISEYQVLEIKSNYENARILLKDIVYCDIAGHYIQIHMQNSQLYRSRMTFAKLIEMLALHPEFLLCYRGCLVNMKHIVRIEYNAFLMTDMARIPFRKKEKNHILKVYSEFLFGKVRNDLI